MRVYFLSVRPCALKINGVFLGFTDGFERFCELTLQDAPFCELIPVDGRAQPIVFLLREDVTEKPPDGVKIFCLPNGIALYADKFIPNGYALKIITEKSLSFGTITVFSQGTPQALIRKKEKAETIVLDERFSDCTIYPLKNGVVLEGLEAICALNEDGTPFYYGKIDYWHYDDERNELSFSTPLQDFGGRKATCVWTFEKKEPTIRKCSLSDSRSLPPKLILCEFLQALLLGIEVKEFLTDALYESLEELKAFFGAYERIAVIDEYPFGAGVALQKKENVYDVKYFSADVENGKIANVRREI